MRGYSHLWLVRPDETQMRPWADVFKGKQRLRRGGCGDDDIGLAHFLLQAGTAHLIAVGERPDGHSDGGKRRLDQTAEGLESRSQRAIEDGARLDRRVRGEKERQVSLDLGARSERDDALRSALKGRQQTSR